jgi:hypothetical protein
VRRASASVSEAEGLPRGEAAATARADRSAGAGADTGGESTD